MEEMNKYKIEYRVKSTRTGATIKGEKYFKTYEKVVSFIVKMDMHNFYFSYQAYKWHPTLKSWQSSSTLL